MHLNRAATILKLLLKFEAVVLIFALPAIFLPTPWMARAHELIGLGTMPRGLLVEYLTRTLSALYATWAPLLFYVSLDVRRHASLIIFLARLRMVLALVLLGIDLRIGMPWYWTTGEVGSVFGVSFIQLLLARKVLQDRP